MSVTATPTAPVAAASLVAGYAVAAGTGVRPLGGLVLAAGTAWCAREWYRRHGPATMGGLLGVQLVGFAASHVLARSLGAWPSVGLVAAISGASALVLADRAPGGALA